MKRTIFSLFIVLLALPMAAVQWTTHFAYNSVNRIAEGDDEVYGVSSGSLFSIHKQTEKITTFSHQDGMHGNNIACIKWLPQISSLMIIYVDGKLDLLKNGKFRYIPDLYNKNVTFSKYCHSVTLKDSLAFMAMDYGVQTFHIRKQEFIDTYFVGPEAAEVPVKSIAFANGAIYAATDSTLLAASLTDNIVDYSYWSSLPLPAPGAIQQIAAAGGMLYMLLDNRCYVRRGDVWQLYDNNTYNALNILGGTLVPDVYPAVENDGIWLAAGDHGVIRRMTTGEQIVYHLDGPLTNNPYRLCYDQDQLFMVAGGRWALQNSTPGVVMRYDGHSWHNIAQQDIVNRVGALCMDIMNVAVDPYDPSHFFASSYGTGLYEFRNDVCVKRWNADNSLLRAAAPNDPQRYTRTDGAIFDKQGNLWVMNGGKANVDYNIVVFTRAGEQVGMNTYLPSGARYAIETVGELIFDRRNEQHVWGIVPRGYDGKESGLFYIDTKGTISNTEDDDNVLRYSWIDASGNEHTYSAIYTLAQVQSGDIWLGTDKGLFVIPADVDYLRSNLCIIPSVPDDNGLDIFAEEVVNDIALDHLGQIWLATQAHGVYVLSADGTTLNEHFTMDNSALPSNTILSLAADIAHQRMYIGSGLGLVAWSDRDDGIRDTYILSDESDILGTMQQWRTHFAYTDIAGIQVTDHAVYALSEGSLCKISKSDESLYYYSKLNGLNGSSIHMIASDAYTHTLLIAYEDGMIDLLTDDGALHPVADLYLKQMNTPKLVQDVAFRQGTAYIAMPFGIIALNLRKQEIRDTYYIGPEGTDLSVQALAIIGDTIVAAHDATLYKASLDDNIVDYALWRTSAAPGEVMQLAGLDGVLYMLADSVMYRNGTPVPCESRLVSLSVREQRLHALADDGHVYEYKPAEGTWEDKTYLAQHHARCVLPDGQTYWLGTADGVLHIAADHSVQKYEPDGPSSNMPYAMTTYGNRLWAVPGGRWAAGFLREGQIMYYNGTGWDNLTYQKICERFGTVLSLYDIGHVAVDPADPDHFYASCFGTGLLEFRPDGTAKRFNHDNSPLVSLDNSARLRYRYCRVDAIAFDAERNLWLTNTGDIATNIHIIDPQGGWHSFNLYNGGQRIVLKTVSKILVDSRNPDYKWIASARETPGLVLLNDNGTPYNGHDDRVIFRQTFVDQDKKSITLDRLNTIAQDHNGDLWLGTGEGILVIDAATNMFQSNACRRMKISRHDGTNLADYLLGTEQINAIVFAGGNRIWIGTDASGVYLVHMVTKEGIYEPEILAHFTAANSPMPSDCVLSVAINEENGEVYIGTAKGLVSYRGDATLPSEDFRGAYVYPNPVRPNFEGTITVNGLMDNTTVYIADAAGNVVCRTHSNGGTAVWDGRTQSGKKAHSGVYTIYCNTADGKSHTVLKVLLMH